MNKQPSSSNPLVSDAYTGLSWYGRIRTLMTAIFGTVLFLAFIILGIYLLFKKNIYTQQISGIITSVNYKTHTDNKYTYYDYTLEVSYIVGGVNYKGTLFVNDLLSPANFAEGNKINFYVNPKDHTQIQYFEFYHIHPTNIQSLELLLHSMHVVNSIHFYNLNYL